MTLLLTNNRMLCISPLISSCYLIRYFVFYCPGDVFYTVMSSFPVQLTLIPLKEVIRMHKIASGVAQAAAIYPSGFLVMLIIGTVKGENTRYEVSSTLTPLQAFQRQPAECNTMQQKSVQAAQCNKIHQQ